MAKLQVPSGAQMKIFWNVDGHTFVNVFGGRATGSGTVDQGTATALGTIVSNAFSSSGIAPAFTTGVNLSQVSIRSVNQVDLPEFFATATGTGTDATTQTLPRGAAAVVTFKTARAGKSGRGRSYMGGFAEGQNIAGSAEAPSISTFCLAFWNAIKTNLATIGYELALLSPALPERQNAAGETLPAKIAFAEPITSITFRNNTWGSQRRRNHRL